MTGIDRTGRPTGPVVVIGGANLDIIARSRETLEWHDSNPGTVTTSPGGVGRNIAETLARLGVPTTLVSALGEGPEADALRDACVRAGLALHRIEAPGVPAPRYVAVLDADGELAVAVNDMRALEAVTPEALGACAAIIEAASVLVLDCNLEPETLTFAARRWKDRPIVVDTVSTVKAVRARSILSFVHTLKANEAEALALTGERDVSGALSVLASVGPKCVVVSRGSAGLVWNEGERRGELRPRNHAAVDVTGAGDALTAGLVYGVLAGYDAHGSVTFGATLAEMVLEHEGAGLPATVRIEDVLGRARGRT